MHVLDVWAALDLQMRYLFRLSTTMKQKLAEASLAVKWKHPIIGMHIGHGDRGHLSFY